MSQDHPGQDGEEEDEDRIRLSPAVYPLLNPDVSASVFSAVVNLLVELVPPLAQPVPGRPGWYSAPLSRDVGLAEYYVGETEPGNDGPNIYVARIVISDDWPDF